MSLLEKMLKAGSVKGSSILSKSDFFKAKDPIKTDLPIINIAFSGSLNGGLIPGLTVLAGVSKSFKTLLGLYCMKAYLDKYKDGVAILYDSEYGITPDYLKSFNIDIDRVIHVPLEDVEQLKFDLTNRLEDVSKGDHVMILIDSIGNLASKKEVEDAMSEKSVADMSRAKQLKSLFRIVTPKLTTRDIPCIAINHVYQEMGLYPKAIVSGGCVVAGTEIQTPTGLKKVEDFNVGERVITMSGENVVTHVWNPETLEEGTPECFKITFEDGHEVICSDKHKFLIGGVWIEAKDLIVGMDCDTI